VFIHDDVVLRPPWQKTKHSVLRINDYVLIQKGSIVEASSIGSYVIIGENCVIGNGSVIKDCVRILDDSYVAPNTVIRPFAIYGGNPGNQIQFM
jgi:dynactin-5